MIDPSPIMESLKYVQENGAIKVTLNHKNQGDYGEIFELARDVERDLSQAVQEETPSGLYGFGPFSLDSNAHRLDRDGMEVALTAGEFNLLRIFVEHPNRVLSRDSLMDLIKGYERTPFDRSIDVRVTRLRRKIEDDPAAPVYIRTVWGEGYLFAPQGKAA